MELRLKILAGSHAGHEMKIAKDRFLIGRSAECHLRPNSEKVSRHHCVFLLADGRVTIRDLGSRNGTLVNGEKIIGEVELTKGDRLEIGPLQFEVRLIVAPVLEEAILVAEGESGISQAIAEEQAGLEQAADPKTERKASQKVVEKVERTGGSKGDDIATWLLDMVSETNDQEDTKDFSKTDIVLKGMPPTKTGAPPLPGAARQEIPDDAGSSDDIDLNATAQALRRLQRKNRNS